MSSYAPSPPPHHTGHAQASSTHGTAFTGVNVGEVAGGGLLAVVLGAALIAKARRIRSART